jgi:hypothetical protein
MIVKILLKERHQIESLKYCFVCNRQHKLLERESFSVSNEFIIKCENCLIEYESYLLKFTDQEKFEIRISFRISAIIITNIIVNRWTLKSNQFGITDEMPVVEIKKRIDNYQLLK